MKCSRCGHDNDSDALYCVECGLVLNGAHSCKACHNWLNRDINIASIVEETRG
ncbi:MAG: zinc ribbon domain-containing protein [Butyricimonas faecihominis]